jgi:ribosomal protein S27AE
MDKTQKDKIIKKLIEKGARLPCPRCGNAEFTVIDGYFNQTLQAQLQGLVIGGPSIPSVVTACTRCGYLAQHALGALGLLPSQDKKEDSK